MTALIETYAEVNGRVPVSDGSHVVNFRLTGGPISGSAALVLPADAVGPELGLGKRVRLEVHAAEAVAAPAPAAPAAQATTESASTLDLTVIPASAAEGPFRDEDDPADTQPLPVIALDEDEDGDE